jgi:hypothetical protein
MKKLTTTVRKEALAAGAAFLKILNETDEAEAAADAARRLLETTQSELHVTQAQLKGCQDELKRAEAEYAQFKKSAGAEQTRINGRISVSQQKLEGLEAQVAEKQTAVNSILAGMAALGKRLATSQGDGNG